MSGLEVFGAVITTLDTTIAIFSAVHDAVGNAKDLPSLLEEYEQECRLSKAIVKNVQSSPGLQHEDVTKAILKVGATVTALDHHLKSLDQGRGRFREIGHQLVSGTQERKKLEKLMDRLNRAKTNLTSIVTVLSSRPAAPITRRIVENNQTSGRARMFNAPVIQADDTRDPWEHITEVIVRGNNAADQSFMLNVAMTTKNLKLLFEELAKEEERQVNAELRAEANANLGSERMDTN